MSGPRPPVLDVVIPVYDEQHTVAAAVHRVRDHLEAVPVDWYDAPDSQVDVAATARDDLAAGVGAQSIRFGLVGAFTTVLHLGLFAAIGVSFAALSPQWGNAIALSLATVVNTGLNRRWTFGVRRRRGAFTNQVQGFAVFGLSWAMSALALAVLGFRWPGAPTFAETLVVGVGTVASTVAKFVLMRRWMFAHPHPPLGATVSAAGDPGPHRSRTPGRPGRRCADRAGRPPRDASPDGGSATEVPASPPAERATAARSAVRPWSPRTSPAVNTVPSGR